MTVKERREHRLNWAADKLLLTVIGFFAVRTYTQIDVLVEKFNTLYTQVQLHEQTLGVLKSLTHLTP